MDYSIKRDTNSTSKFVLIGEPETEELLGVTVTEPGVLGAKGLEKGRHYASRRLETFYELDIDSALEMQLEAGVTLSDYGREDYEIVEVDGEDMQMLFDKIRDGEPENILGEIDDNFEEPELDFQKPVLEDESGIPDHVKAKKKMNHYY